MDQFSGQVAIVTGAASGIGFAIASRLYSEGAKVVLLDRNEEALAEAQHKVGADVSTFALDLTDEALVASVINKVESDFGRIDILVNSAGVTGVTNIKTHEVSTDDVRFVFEVNFMASFFTSRAVLPVRKAMRACLPIRLRKQRSSE